MNNITSHYKNIGNRYERQYQQLFGSHRTRIVQYIVDRVLPTQKTGLTICDIGGGTGATLEMLRGILGPGNTYVLVEPSSEMLEQANSFKRADVYDQKTAEEFVLQQKYNHKIDVIICQEMIHHVRQPLPLFEGAYRLLKSPGRLLIITRPTDVEFPFGQNGKQAWKASYFMDPKAFPSLLEQAGFKVTEDIVSYSLSIDKTSWMGMVGQEPVFSNISALSLQQREEDLKEIQAKEEILHFKDHLILIQAEK